MPPSPTLPATYADDPLGAYGSITLHFTPPLTLVEFQAFAQAYRLVHVPQGDEP